MDYFQVWNTGYGPDSFVYIRLSYTDGDGDLGLNEDDTTGAFGYGQPDFYNLQVLMYEKKNGAWIRPMNPLAPVPDTIQFSERIPRITPTGRYKWISGNLELNIPAAPYSLKPDTVKYRIRLTDRMLHRSDWIETPVVIFKH